MTHHANSWRLSCALLICASLLAGVGCSSTQAAHQGNGGSNSADGAAAYVQETGQRGDSIAQATPAQCGPFDSTVSCCLKQHPGEFERCGAIDPGKAPTRAPKQAPRTDPNPYPPPTTDPYSPPTDAAPPDRRKRDQQCRVYWNQCIALGGEYEKRGQHGRTICASCYDQCMGLGYWPKEVNDFECLGGF